MVAQRRLEAPDDAAAQVDAKVAEIAEVEKQMDANNISGRRGRGDDSSAAGRELQRWLGQARAHRLGIGRRDAVPDPVSFTYVIEHF